MDKRYKHGMCGTKIYDLWASMIHRCHNKNASNYDNYGGRGVYVCSEWKNFIDFYEWVKTTNYTDGLSIDRINHDLGYSPDNCRWIKRVNQTRNRRKQSNSSTDETGVNTHKDTRGNISRFVARWCDENGNYRSKSFSINKYGYDEAFSLAKEFRSLQIEMLREMGIFYDHSHGQ